MFHSSRALIVTAAAAALLITSGCTTPDNPVPGGQITYQIPNLPESGFLGDYSALKLATAPAFAVVGRKIYIAPEADLKDYGKVVIDPVSFAYLKPGLDLTAAEKERLTQYLNEWLNLKLKDRFMKVPVAGPKTLRVRTAITDVSSPEGIKSREVNMADVARAVVELELTDSETGHRFLAMVDQMGGVRFTIAKEDLSKEKEMYINWFDGLSGEMESGAMKSATPTLEH